MVCHALSHGAISFSLHQKTNILIGEIGSTADQMVNFKVLMPPYRQRKTERERVVSNMLKTGV